MDTYLARLPRILEHLQILLKDRGYIPPVFPKSSEEIISRALHTNKSIGQCLTFKLSHVALKTNLVVSFIDPIFDAAKNKEIMTSSYQIYGVKEEYINYGDHGLIICYGKLSPDATKEIIKLRKKNIQVITHASLTFPITHHVMYKSHTALSSKEAADWEAKQRIKRCQLPILKYNDPVRIWFGWPKDTIVKIDRGAYRCVK
jgi:DNA-directed RNA polymerase subunit H (RpoH/RPB5)